MFRFTIHITEVVTSNVRCVCVSREPSSGWDRLGDRVTGPQPCLPLRGRKALPVRVAFFSSQVKCVCVCVCVRACMCMYMTVCTWLHVTLESGSGSTLSLG